MQNTRIGVLIVSIISSAFFFTGCAQYKPLVRPIPKLSVISPTLSEPRMEKMLKENVKPEFPAVLAVAKVENAYPADIYEGPEQDDRFAIISIPTQEREGWLNLKKGEGQTHRSIIRRVQFINPSILRGNPSLKSLRNAATQLNAPLLLIYIQQDSGASNFNFIPGYTVGYISVCQAALVDTRTGIVIGTAESEAKNEEKVTIFGVEAAKTKFQNQTRSEAVTNLQKNISRGFAELEK